jgi:hypothetical protein
MVKRKSDSKGAALAARTRHANLSAMRLDSPLRDRKSEAEPTGIARTTLIHSIEAIEDARSVLGGDSGSGILDRDGDGALILFLYLQ